MYNLNVFLSLLKIYVKVGDKSQKRQFYKNIEEIQSYYLLLVWHGLLETKCII